MDASVDTRQLEPLAYIDADGRKHNFDAPPSSGDPLGQGWCLGRFYKSYVDYLLSIKDCVVLKRVWESNLNMVSCIQETGGVGADIADEITYAYERRYMKVVEHKPLMPKMGNLTRIFLLSLVYVLVGSGVYFGALGNLHAQISCFVVGGFILVPVCLSQWRWTRSSAGEQSNGKKAEENHKKRKVGSRC